MSYDFNKLEKIKGTDDYELLKEILLDLKNVEVDLTDRYSICQHRDYIKRLLHNRLFMKTEYICDTELVVSDKNKEIYIILNKVIDWLLDYFEGKYTNINMIDMTNNCVPVALKVKEFCDEFSIECEVVEIYPGFDQDARIFDGNGFHYFNIITIDNKKYLVDLTYKQFFKKNNNYLEEIGILYLCAPVAGVFMLMDSERSSVASELLRDGFIELKENVLKHYCDGFALSYRNGLYYKINDNSYLVSYSDEDYISFLFGDDSQFKREGKEFLGRMKKYQLDKNY